MHAFCIEKKLGDGIANLRPKKKKIFAPKGGERAENEKCLGEFYEKKKILKFCTMYKYNERDLLTLHKGWQWADKEVERKTKIKNK